MRKLIKIIKEKWLRQTSLTVLLVVITLAVFLGLNILIRKLDLAPIDFTKEKLYSLSDDSKNEVKDINYIAEIRGENSNVDIDVQGA